MGASGGALLIAWVIEFELPEKPAVLAASRRPRGSDSRAFVESEFPSPDASLRTNRVVMVIQIQKCVFAISSMNYTRLPTTSTSAGFSMSCHPSLPTLVIVG